MTSISMPAALPALPPVDATSDLPVPNKTAHARRTSRNPRLAPLPTFIFNPESMNNMANAQESGSPAAGLVEEESVNQPSQKNPPPLPAFSFNPGATMASGNPLPSPTHPILEEMAQNRSRSSSRPAALPVFSFNSGPGEKPKTPSPTKSSFAQDPPGSARSMGHRRRGSDLIGAGERGPPSITAPPSGSPQKSALGLSVNAHGPPRFSHQHRRSQAVSITEFETSELIKANAISKHRAGSVPPTPSDLPCTDRLPRASQSASSLCDQKPSVSLPRRASASGGRPRVGFSDTVDVIHRPLSMISSETEGSTSTVRGRHSLTGSITSLRSLAARPGPSPTHDDNRAVPRPQTADAASLSLPTKLDSGDVIMASDVLPRPSSASDSVDLPSSSNSPVSKKRFWFTPGSVESSPRITPIQTPTIEAENPASSSSPSISGAQVADKGIQSANPSERRAGIKKRKVRTLAGAIFSRKTRSRPVQGRGRRTPTPPLSRPYADDARDAVFDGDNTVVIADSAFPVQGRQHTPTLITDMPSRSITPRSDHDGDGRVTSPVVDLDAALGPFGSEEMLPRSGFAAARGRMHSSMGTGAGDTFGSLHQRAESAPQMPPVNKNLLGVHRLGSNGSVAADVFDEKEENDFLAEENKPKDEFGKVPVLMRAGLKTAPSVEPDTGNVVKHAERASSRSPIGLAISTKASDGIEIVDAEEAVTREAARSSNSTLTAPVVPESEGKQPIQSPMAFVYPAPAPQTSYASSIEARSVPSSSIPSPDPDHVTFDKGLRFYRPTGEPSPEFGVFSSTEDVPSLCNSESTGNAPRISSGAGTQSSADPGPASVSAAHTTSRTNTAQPIWKRASLASLNKLIPHSAHSDTSRPRFEKSTKHEREEKMKKGSRISRLMTFWRTKERENR